MNDQLADVEAQRRADVALDGIRIAKRKWSSTRPRGLTAREALIALQFEAMVVLMCASSLREGTPLSAEDFASLILACSRIDAIADEVVG